MAIVKNGANGSFIGKVGSVVGYEWKGVAVIRGLPKVNKHRKPTVLELANRHKMRLIQAFLQPALPFVRLGFSLEAKSRNISAFNAAMSYNKKYAFIGEYPDLSIDYYKTLLSTGSLAKPQDVEIALADDGIAFKWNPANGDPKVRTMLLILSEYRPLSAMMLGGATQRNGQEVLAFSCAAKSIPKGTKIHAFMAFITTMHDAISDSVYCGAIEI